MWLLSLHRSGANPEFRRSQVWDLAPAMGEDVRVEDPDPRTNQRYTPKIAGTEETHSSHELYDWSVLVCRVTRNDAYLRLSRCPKIHAKLISKSEKIESFPLGPLGFERAQHRPSPRPSLKRIRTAASSSFRSFRF